MCSEAKPPPSLIIAVSTLPTASSAWTFSLVVEATHHILLLACAQLSVVSDIANLSSDLLVLPERRLGGPGVPAPCIEGDALLCELLLAVV